MLVCKKEEKVDGEGQKQCQRVQQAKANGEGASRRITERGSFCPTKEMETGPEGRAALTQSCRT